MTNSVDDIRADIAFMKNVVEDGGRQSAVTGGAILIAGGVIYAAASLLIWAGAMRYIPFPDEYGFSIWGGAFVLILIAIALILKFFPRGAQSPGDRGISAVWAGAGAGITALSVANLGISITTHMGVQWALMPSIAMAFYGASWFVAAQVSGAAWSRYVAFACFFSAAAFGFLVTSPTILLAFAASMILLAAVPGLYLMRTGARV